ncbi:MAG: T9SS type A sorting domain-containing protein [Bacteroidetes bacterium]|nr:T9SS type A sorting domain-containing protein [Bacteroidota bacterium]
MRSLLVFGMVGIAVYILSPSTSLESRPSFNGTTAGCGGGGCHASQSGIVSASTDGLTVTVTLTGLTSGNVGGELVDGSGTVVALNNSTSQNPFTLTAPGAGTYTVNAGFKSPSLVWESKQVTLTPTGVERSAPAGSIPQQPRLNQNYPNPFNPTSTIEYFLPMDAAVSLEVFDQQGQHVRTLVSHRQSAGHHAVRFDADGLASGVYLYRLTAGQAAVIKKMALVR